MEISKRCKLQSVLLNTMEMYAFFYRMYEGKSGFNSYINQGCFTAKFCMTLLESQAPTDKMSLLARIASLDYKSQIQEFFDFNNQCLKQLYVLRNVSIEDVFTKNQKPHLQKLQGAISSNLYRW